MVSIKDVAKFCNVSVATVSRVINNTVPVSDSAREAVLNAVEQLGYKPNLFGRSLRSNETKIILVMLSSIANSFCSKVIRSIDKTASSLGYYTIICTTNGEKVKEEYYTNFAGNGLADGIIILNSSLSREDLISLSKRIPLVQCNEYFKNVAAPYVAIDNYKAAYEAVTLLIKNGRKRIVHISADNNFISTKDRLCGYKDALKDNNIVFDENLILQGNYGYRNTVDLFEDFINKKIEFDGIFAISDRMAAGALNVLTANSYSVPEDVEIIGFDNTDISYTSNPSITTVSQPHTLLGSNAVKQLMNIINNNSVDNVLLQHKIVKRNSTKN